MWRDSRLKITVKLQPYIFVCSSIVLTISSFGVNCMNSEYGTYIWRNRRWVLKNKCPIYCCFFFHFLRCLIYLLLLLLVHYCQNLYQLIDPISFVLLLVYNHKDAIRHRLMYIFIIFFIVLISSVECIQFRSLNLLVN